jgi:hypothetical protein
MTHICLHFLNSEITRTQSIYFLTSVSKIPYKKEQHRFRIPPAEPSENLKTGEMADKKKIDCQRCQGLEAPASLHIRQRNMRQKPKQRSSLVGM